MNAEHPPIHLISGQPPGWTNKLIERSATEASFCRSKNWLQITGVETCNTNLSMIIPVHNEKKLLPAVIASLGFINLPFDANINIIFVSNNCTDGSQKIITAGLN